MTDIAKLSAQLEELNVHIIELKEIAKKQNHDVLMANLNELKEKIKVQSIKIDALNGISNITVVSQQQPIVRVAVTNENDPPVPVIPEKVQKININEYFKRLWCTEEGRSKIYEKNIFTKERYEQFKVDNPTMFDKKDETNIEFQKKVAVKIWKLIDKPSQEDLKSLREKDIRDSNKLASTDLEQENP